MERDAAGNITIETASGELVEHAPQSFTDGNVPVSSSYSLKGNDVQFNFPGGYNSNQTLVIDPWITVLTTMPPDNMGFDIDYDLAGNTYVYGAGPTTNSDVTDFFCVAKFNATGVAQWTFLGQVASINWTTATTALDYNYPGNSKTDKVTGKVYVCKGFDYNGTSTIRLQTNGAYDNFISTIDNTWYEAWGMAYNCGTGQILAVGGGTVSNLNMAVINTTTGVATTSNITGIVGSTDQDILCGVYDTAGNYYVLMCDIISGVLPYPNTMYKLNSTYTGNVWAANSTFTTFQESQNSPFWNAGGGSSSNWFNCLAANSSYLSDCAGVNVAAYDFNTGAMVGTPTTVSGYAPDMQGGIAVDNCNNMPGRNRGLLKLLVSTAQLLLRAPIFP